MEISKLVYSLPPLPNPSLVICVVVCRGLVCLLMISIPALNNLECDRHEQATGQKFHNNSPIIHQMSAFCNFMTIFGITMRNTFK